MHPGPSGEGVPVWAAGPPPLSPSSVRGAPATFDRRPQVLVVGGGVVGLSVAAACRRRGASRVVVIDAGPVAGAASGRAAGLLAPEPHAWTEPAAFVELGRRSLQLTREMDAETGGALGVRDMQCLLAGARVEDALSPLAVPVETLDRAAVRDREPALAGVEQAVLVPGQARVNPVRLAAALADGAGTVVTGVGAGELVMAGDRVAAVETGAGRLLPDSVVVATGVAPFPYVPVPHHWVKGHLATTEPVPFRLGCQVVAPFGGAFQLDDGRLLTGGTLDHGDGSPAVNAAVLAGMRKGLEALVPAAAGVPFSHTWCCFRPAAPDHLPLVDRIPGTANAWFASGMYRTGLLLAAAVGQALALWIATDSRPPELAPFGLARLGVASD